MDHRDTKQAKAPLDLVRFWVISIFLHTGAIFLLFTEIAVFDFRPGNFCNLVKIGFIRDHYYKLNDNTL